MSKFSFDNPENKFLGSVEHFENSFKNLVLNDVVVYDVCINSKTNSVDIKLIIQTPWFGDENRICETNFVYTCCLNLKIYKNKLKQTRELIVNQLLESNNHKCINKFNFYENQYVCNIKCHEFECGRIFIDLFGTDGRNINEKIKSAGFGF